MYKYSAFNTTVLALHISAFFKLQAHSIPTVLVHIQCFNTTCWQFTSTHFFKLHSSEHSSESSSNSSYTFRHCKPFVSKWALQIYWPLQLHSHCNGSIIPECKCSEQSSVISYTFQTIQYLRYWCTFNASTLRVGNSRLHISAFNTTVLAKHSSFNTTVLAKHSSFNTTVLALHISKHSSFNTTVLAKHILPFQPFNTTCWQHISSSFTYANLWLSRAICFCFQLCSQLYSSYANLWLSRAICFCFQLRA